MGTIQGTQVTTTSSWQTVGQEKASTATGTVSSPVLSSPAHASQILASTATASSSSAEDRVSLSAAAQQSSLALELNPTTTASEEATQVGSQLEEQQKATARERLRGLKKQIETLNKLIGGMPESMTKGAMQQLRMLTEELHRIADILGSGSKSKTDTSTSADTSQLASANQAAASAAEQGEARMAETTATEAMATSAVDSSAMDKPVETDQAAADTEQIDKSTMQEPSSDLPIGLQILQALPKASQEQEDGQALLNVSQSLTQIVERVARAVEPEDKVLQDAVNDSRKHLAQTAEVVETLLSPDISLRISTPQVSPNVSG
ncbi:hypothetical protein ACKC9G_00285 [Pokkaliibacter sp. CJK22405]|uniref:hypothetical protein n=1 Tax=Pokkaliibacter sp. CJK22405 TaxID=3384615 RepID=UPI003984A2E7